MTKPTLIITILCFLIFSTACFVNLISTKKDFKDVTAETEKQIAKDSGLVIVYGASDDLMEFEGAIEDEIGCYDGDTIHITKQFKKG